MILRKHFNCLLLPFVLFLIITTNIHAQFKISGNVKDKKQNELPFVSIYVQGSTNGTLSNESGAYYLNMPSGKVTIIVQYVGYVAQSRIVNVTKDQTLDFVLEEETLKLEEVIIKSGEDPSIPIIKKAIKKRSSFLKNPNAFKAELYIKALMKIVDAPKSFLGQDLGNMDGTLDSNRQGILYFSESISNVNFLPPNKYKEELISSKVSGESRGISVNQFSYANFNFYEEYIGLFREMISPLADNALAYYNYYLYETFKDENGYDVHKIKVKPKSQFTPCFNGFIYITEELYNIQSLDLMVSGKSIKNAILDSIHIRQVYVPSSIDKNRWNLITQNIGFNIKVLVFKSKGNFNYVFKNYNYNPDFENQFFNNELFVVREDAIKNDSTFWLKNRPISLTEEETKDYSKKDSIAKVINAPAYLDSVDRVNRKFKWSDIFLGYNAGNSMKKIGYGITNPFSSIQFNAIEGFNFQFRPYFTKRNEDDQLVYNSYGGLSYGFSDKKVKAFGNVEYNYDVRSLSSINISGGNDYFQFNEQGIVSKAVNTYFSLLDKQNALKLFNKKYLRLGWASEIMNGLYITTTLEYANRISLENNTNYSFFRKDRVYENNSQFNSSNQSYKFNDKILKQSFSFQWSPDQKYQTYPTYKNRIKSDWPTLYAYFDIAYGLSSQYVNYTKLKINIIDNYVSTKSFGYMKYRIEAGKFFTKGNTNVIDYFHFKGNNLLGGFRSPYLNTFKLQRDYDFSTTNEYAAVWLEQYFDGFMNDHIPILNKLGITGIWSLSALQQKNLTYIEPGIGIEGIKLGAFDIARVDYFWGIANGTLKDKGVRIGFSLFIESLFGR